MKIKIILDHLEVQAMVDKMEQRKYDRLKIFDAGHKIILAYKEFLKTRSVTKVKVSESQIELDDYIK